MKRKTEFKWVNSKDVSHATEKLNPTIGNCNVFPATATASSYSCVLLGLNFAFCLNISWEHSNDAILFKLKKRDIDLPIVSMKNVFEFVQWNSNINGWETHIRHRRFLHTTTIVYWLCLWLTYVYSMHCLFARSMMQNWYSYCSGRNSNCNEIKMKKLQTVLYKWVCPFPLLIQLGLVGISVHVFIFISVFTWLCIVQTKYQLYKNDKSQW